MPYPNSNRDEQAALAALRQGWDALACARPPILTDVAVASNRCGDELVSQAGGDVPCTAAEVLSIVDRVVPGVDSP
jgi:hypothetical protein